MNLIQEVTRKAKTKLSSQFVRNLGWLGMSEIIYRILRLGVVIIIARQLSRYDYGLGAIILAVREFSLTFTNIGIGAKIIQAEEKELDVLCNSAYWLNWTMFVSLFILQSLAAFPIAWFYKTPDIILPIAVSGIAYLIWPITGIQKTLIQRENRFKIIAINDSIQNSLGSILAAILALSGVGVWAFVIPGILVAPLEIVIFSKNHSWRPTSAFTTKHWNEIFSFGKNLLGVALLRTLRNNLDYLIVGRIGVKELGIYFLGFNAGLGISLSIINSINSAILPHLCADRSDWVALKKRFLNSLKIISLAIVPFVLFQSLLAPFYVPLIFGEKGEAAVSIVILICLSAIPRPFADAASQLLVAIGKPDLDLRWNIIFTAIFTAAVVIGINWNITGVATAVLLVHIICLPLFTLWAIRYVFPKINSL